MGPNRPGDWNMVKNDDGDWVWVQTPQRMIRALEIEKRVNLVIEELKIPVRENESSKLFMSEFQVQQLYPAMREIYDEHIESYIDYEGWCQKR